MQRTSSWRYAAIVIACTCMGCGGGGSPGDADTDDATEMGENPDVVTDTEEEPGPEACHESIEGWDPSWRTLEEQVVDEVNVRRAAGADCGSEGTFDPAGAVTMEPRLQCAARVHSLYMYTEDAFGYDTPGGVLGEDLWETVEGAGYTGTVVTQEIAFGMETAAELVENLMVGGGVNCANVMHPDATQVGVGHADSIDHYWTMVFGHE